MRPLGCNKAGDFSRNRAGFGPSLGHIKKAKNPGKVEGTCCLEGAKGPSGKGRCKLDEGGKQINRSGRRSAGDRGDIIARVKVLGWLYGTVSRWEICGASEGTGIEISRRTGSVKNPGGGDLERRGRA